MRPFVAVDYDIQGHPVTADQYPGVLAQVFGADAAEVLARYPAGAYPSPGFALATVPTDWGHKLDGGTVLPADRGSELAYLFDGAFNEPGGSPTLSPRQQRLSSPMIAYWSNFAATGNPDGAGLPRSYTSRSDGRLLSPAAGSGGYSLCRIFPHQFDETAHRV